MLTIVDGALAEARTLAHRIMDHDGQSGNGVGAPNFYQLPGRPCCLFKDQADFWAPGFLLKEHQEPLRTKMLINIAAKKTLMKAKEAMHCVGTGQQATQTKEHPPDPILTNPRREPKQSPTLTVWLTNGTLGTQWQQQHLLFVKQQELWQKAEV